MKQDKRGKERFSANLFAELSSVSGTSYGRAVVVDVSLSGIAVETEGDLTVGEQIECHVEIPLRLSAKVMRIVSPGQVKRYGLRFVGQSLFDKLVLRKVLKGQRTSRKVSL